MAWKQIKGFDINKMGKTAGMCLANCEDGFGIAKSQRKYASAKDDKNAQQKNGTLHPLNTIPTNVAVPVYCDTTSVYEHVIVCDHGTYYSDGVKTDIKKWKVFGWGECCGGVRVVEYVANSKTNEEVAAEVWQGLWGTGNQRKSRLEAAGYDYAAIQRLVDAGVGKPTANPAPEAPKAPETPPNNEEVPSAPNPEPTPNDNTASEEEHTRTDNSSENKNQEADASDGKAETLELDTSSAANAIEEASEFFNFSPTTKLVAYLIGDAFLAAAALTPSIINCILATDLISFGTALTATLTQAGVLILMIFKLVKKGSK